MKLASWNVNSIRMRNHFINKLLKEENPDLIFLQEIKCIDADFPYALFPGYQCVVSGQKTYNGVAIIIKKGIDFNNIEKIELGGTTAARYLQLEISGITFICIYVPCGAGDPEKFAYKLRFLDDLYDRLNKINAGKIVIAGDFNVAITDQDVQYPAVYFDSVLCLPEVRMRMNKILNIGFNDRVQNPGTYTWWDYRRPFNGLRLDYILTKGLEGIQTIRPEYRRLKIEGTGPSDHIPVIMNIVI